MKYFGDITEDATIHIPFNTNNGDGASVTFTGTTVKVYKDDATGTESVAGVTLSKDHDGITGTHLVTIGTSADAFYATGSDYQVELQAATIDSQTVNAWLGSFSIQNRFMRGTDGASTLIATDIVSDGAALDTTGGSIDLVLVSSAANVVTLANGVITDQSIATDAFSNTKFKEGCFDADNFETDTIIADTLAASAITKIQAGISTDVWNEDISGIATANSAGTIVNATLTDTGTTLPATLTEMQGAAFDSATDSLKSIRDRGDAAWVTGGAGGLTAADIWNHDISGIDTAGSAGASVTSTLEDTGTTLPATLVQMQGQPFDSATDSLRAIRDRGDAAWTTATSTTASNMRGTDNAFTAASAAAGITADMIKIDGVALTETSDGNLATNFSTFYDNADAATAKVVDDVGGGAASVPPSIR